jgi:hypothetical protein
VRVVWPHGFVGRWEGDRLALLDGAGTVLALVGDRVDIGGGYSAGSWFACWYVDVLAPAATGPSAQPTGEQTPAPKSSSTPKAFDCVGPPLPPGSTPEPVSVPRLVDETGLVVSCIQTDYITELVGTISVSNPFEPDAVEVVREMAPCDAGMVFTLRLATDAFELVGERPLGVQTHRRPCRCTSRSRGRCARPMSGPYSLPGPPHRNANRRRGPHAMASRFLGACRQRHRPPRRSRGRRCLRRRGFGAQ